MVSFFSPKIRRVNNFEIAFKISNIFNSSYITNGWAGRVKSSYYDQASDDPYAIKDSGDYYYYIGLFPQKTQKLYVET
ncbi:MAG: hypothetical protein R2771_05680 [Saprospiraceae bacterium]